MNKFEKNRLTRKFGGYWERKCLGCGEIDFKGDDHGLTSGFGGGPNGETVHSGNKGCGGLVEEKWVGRGGCP